jgi:hypothetical protein
MVSKLPMLAMKFNRLSIKKLLPFLNTGFILLASALSFGWLSFPSLLLLT